jgi:hypothetical protein
MSLLPCRFAAPRHRSAPGWPALGLHDASLIAAGAGQPFAAPHASGGEKPQATRTKFYLFPGAVALGLRCLHGAPLHTLAHNGTLFSVCHGRCASCPIRTIPRVPAAFRAVPSASALSLKIRRSPKWQDCNAGSRQRTRKVYPPRFTSWLGAGSLPTKGTKGHEGGQDGEPAGDRGVDSATRHALPSARAAAATGPPKPSPLCWQKRVRGFGERRDPLLTSTELESCG